MSTESVWSREISRPNQLWPKRVSNEDVRDRLPRSYQGG